MNEAPFECSSATVCVVGLGYVGLPLAVALSRSFRTVGFDVDRERVRELLAHHDRTGELTSDALKAAALAIVDKPEDCPPSDHIIVTVPTPIDQNNRPDLTILRAASTTVGGMVKVAARSGRRPIVIFESTVYPGVTEEVCAPLIEHASKLVCGRDFFLGYSPERINPGDREHTVDKIVKVVSGQTPEVLDKVAALYETVTSGGVFRARSIRAAEAAKVIENAQRDINIAFMNEVTQIFARLDLSVWDVLAAARTKWNFLPFAPGLVGGHCIGVDPYYLAHRAVELGHDPQVILAGRATNDGMAQWVAERLHDGRSGRAGRTLVLGLTFKENVPDLRNSKVADMIVALSGLGHHVEVHDPHADPEEAKREYGLVLTRELPDGLFDLIILAVPHEAILAHGVDALRARLAPGGTLADLKGVLEAGADWTL